MIGSMTYEQVENIAASIMQATEVVETYIEGKNIEELEDFISTVEGYSKYLKTIVELNKDADKALEELKNRK